MGKTIAMVAAVLLVLFEGGRAGAVPQASPMKEVSVATKAKQDLTDAASRLAYMRKHMRPYWDATEMGGIFLLPSMDEDKIATFFQDLQARIPAGPPDMYAMLSDEIAEFFAKAKLEPGEYQLENYHTEYARDGKLVFDSNGNAETVLPPGNVFTFTVTGEHLRLLRHMNTRSWYNYIELMDPKRPYGNMTYFYLDMSEALGEPRPPRDADNRPAYTKEQIGRFLKLHREMLFCVQAFWAYAM
jgi:hypothetical protein